MYLCRAGRSSHVLRGMHNDDVIAATITLKSLITMAISQDARVEGADPADLDLQLRTYCLNAWQRLTGAIATVANSRNNTMIRHNPNTYE